MHDAHYVLQPYFDAARDAFLKYEPQKGVHLTKLKRTRFLVDPGVHDAERHFAMCREDGMLIKVAPELATQPAETVVAILTHELGHAADFAYPAHFWLERAGTAAVWRPPSGKGAARERGRWDHRTSHEIELWADAVAQAAVGAVIRYSGACLLQTFGRGEARPTWLR